MMIFRFTVPLFFLPRASLVVVQHTKEQCSEKGTISSPVHRFMPYNHACALLDFWSVAFYQRLLHPYLAPPRSRPCLPSPPLPSLGLVSFCCAARRVIIIVVVVVVGTTRYEHFRTVETLVRRRSLLALGRSGGGYFLRAKPGRRTYRHGGGGRVTPRAMLVTN